MFPAVLTYWLLVFWAEWLLPVTPFHVLAFYFDVLFPKFGGMYFP